jgi:hypothetical protein
VQVQRKSAGGASLSVEEVLAAFDEDDRLVTELPFLAARGRAARLCLLRAMVSRRIDLRAAAVPNALSFLMRLDAAVEPASPFTVELESIAARRAPAVEIPSPHLFDLARDDVNLYDEWPTLT